MRDPIGPAGVNLYSYVRGRILRYNDPLGLEEEECEKPPDSWWKRFKDWWKSEKRPKPAQPPADHKGDTVIDVIVNTGTDAVESAGGIPGPVAPLAGAAAAAPDVAKAGFTLRFYGDNIEELANDTEKPTIPSAGNDRCNTHFMR